MKLPYNLQHSCETLIMEVFTVDKVCKYCSYKLKICEDEGLECMKCSKNVHIRCLSRGSVPGGLHGDIFFSFECLECSSGDCEKFIRNKISWLQIICLVLYHMQIKSTGLARKGFFHWRHHVAAFIDKNWEILFPPDAKKKKKWTGTVAGTLSHFSPYIFLSGTFVFNEPAWWALLYPKLSPLAISSLHAVMIQEKQLMKSRKDKLIADAELFKNILTSFIKNEEFLQTFIVGNLQIHSSTKDDSNEWNKDLKKETTSRVIGTTKRKNSLAGLGNRKLLKLADSPSTTCDEQTNNSIRGHEENVQLDFLTSKEEESKQKKITFYDPFCHYNTTLNNIARMKNLTLQAKLTGGIRRELILSPYSEIYLKPYIRRDVDSDFDWLKVMEEIQVVANRKNPDFVLPPRAPLDYIYVQPEHIPAINSICNQYFWPGIDLTDALQYPDFSCVALYKKLIVGFAFLIPNVSHTESYMSFLFTRPGWRNCGIGKFMLYHLIQTSLGKDITLHVSINSPALFLYQRFGFKVDHIVLDFYDKYLRSDVKESKHAYFCRLER